MFKIKQFWYNLANLLCLKLWIFAKKVTNNFLEQCLLFINNNLVWKIG